MEQPIKAVITGGTGFVGSHVVEEFLRNGMKVTCLLRLGRKDTSWLSGLPVEIAYASLTDSASLAPIVADADYVVHVAGTTKAVKNSDYRVGNVETTRALLQALDGSRALRKFCLVSSLTAAGPSPGPQPIDETVPPHPLTPYGISKRAAEDLCLAVAEKMPIVIVRPPAVFGPRDRDILHLFRSASFGVFPFTGPRDKELSLIHARDLAAALFQTTVHPETAGKTYFAANEQPYLMRDVVQNIGALMGKRVLTIPVPRWTAFGLSALSQLALRPFGKPAVLSFGKVIDLYEPRWTCDPGRMYREVGFRSQIPLKEGLRDTIEWYREHHWI